MGGRHGHGGQLSVRARIMLAILLVAAIGMGASAVAVYLVERRSALNEVDSKLLQVVEQLQSIAAGDAMARPPASVDEFLSTAMQRILPEPNESVLGVLNGAPAFVPDAQLPFRIDQDEKFVDLLVTAADSESVVTGTSVRPIGAVRYVIVPVVVTGDPAAGFYVSAYSLDPVLKGATEVLRTSLIVASIALLMIGVVGWFVAGRLLRPIRLLQETADRMTAAQLGERIPVHGNDDVSRLTRTVNALIARLEQAFGAQRRLVDDVSHELRTPITIIRGQLELLDGSRPDRVDAVRAMSLDELDRMSALVSELSVLAESGMRDFVVPAETSVDELLSSLLEKAKSLSSAHVWRIRSDTDAVVALDPTRVAQALLQLAQNAVKYSEPGTTVMLGAETAGAGAQRELRLWVRDQGIGVPADQQELIFGRFHRVESGRGIEGSGLGLSIVSAIAAAHGGRVSVDSEHGIGSTFTIVIPAPTEDDDNNESEDG
ncbi:MULTISPECIES: HAMP domain-containing sensor histidine kinase [unclassified Diaminobutyricimonas]|uniref:sensor histidine kinase n=1 Tax=unclassified Diaminobutyricimonas TaxID=2643261 RepID=UPI0012F50C23|nr:MULTISPECIES: HAMP domain-containing sensor histidine kinase [unclassified Diaminobutyricimonas]